MSGRRLLVLTHEMTRTGAPIVLLRFLRWLARNEPVEVTVVVPRSGPLLADFEEVATVVELEGLIGKSLLAGERLAEIAADGAGIGTARRGAELAARIRKVLRRRGLRSIEDPDLVLVNSVAAAELLTLAPPSAPIVAWVHEMGFTIDHLLPAAAWTAITAHVDHVVAVGAAVAKDVVARGFPVERVSTCSGFVEAVDGCVEPVDRRTLGVPDSAFLVTSCGSRDWRKGFDLVPRLARHVYDTAPDLDIHFCWIGGKAAPFVEDQFRYDAARLGVGDIVHLVPPTNRVAAHLAAADLLATTSREDPYPLVNIEAAQVGTPLVTFESGGSMDFAALGAGVYVPYGDITAMGEVVVALARNRDRLAALSTAARAVAAAHSTDVLAPRLAAAIDSVASR